MTVKKFTTVIKVGSYYLTIALYVGIIIYIATQQEHEGSVFDWITYGFISSSLPYLFLNICGLLFGHPFYKEDEIGDLKNITSSRIIIRIVTRGHNPNLVHKTVDSALSVLSRLSKDAYHVEVVTDRPNNLPIQSNVTELVVPCDYRCSTKYKGRALQYALTRSSAFDLDWIVHLDEETRFDEYTLKYILQFVNEQDEYYIRCEDPRVKYPAIGQGVISYGQQRVESFCHVITTLADSIRVTDDFGRFRLQFAFGTSLFGMKGSYIVIRNDLEKFISFDHGIKSSVTEDAFFALYARSKNITFRFVKGLMYERSPFSFMDFIRQRKRWFIGLSVITTATKIPLWYRKELIFCMVLWLLQPLSYIWILINFARTIDYNEPNVMPLVVNPFTFIYILGFFLSINRDEYTLPEYTGLLVSQVLLIPLFSIMEFSGIIYALVTWDMGFFVVQKEPSQRVVNQGYEVELQSVVADDLKLN